MSICATSLRLGILPGAALGGFLGGVIVTSLAGRLATPRERRGLFVRRRGRRPCPKCAGFGISRCTLCNGEGICSNYTKVTPQIPCPLCVMRRYIPCSMCRGSGCKVPRREANIAFATVTMSIRRFLDQIRARVLFPATMGMLAIPSINKSIHQYRLGAP